MDLQIVNNVYQTCANYCSSINEYSKPLTNKIIEIAKQCFSILCNLAFGFCAGAMAACFYFFINTSIETALDFKALKIMSIAGGLLGGVCWAVDAWQKRC
ncbi:MAG: hypothetical protein LW832_03125 [Parachlamydia sp.]|nr:hypothetical protein [Parachlamydia sp.]